MAKPKRAATGREREIVRCAIYTRKSTEEGLEQEFNSLDAQREACAAYILSQRHEGWVELPTFYDDGGFSGGNKERPGLKQLLAEVECGKVDVIVLYKVDRLTRSLADFARIVEVLDGAGASFVSVTQSFNTTNSMRRLTLNVLLSFAQFEREVTGERIRDKVAASKAKGMWMGGVVPLGYRVKDRKLLIHDEDAATVRMIFDRYAKLRSTTALTDELHHLGIVSKQRVLSDGRTFGGRAFTRGALTHLLKNRVYIGEVTHRDQVYPGEHLSIIERELWKRVQVLLAANTRERRTISRATGMSLLTGMISDGLARPMSPTHATKGSRRYRYYVSRTEHDDAHRSWRLPAHAIEQLVIERVSSMIGQGDVLAERLPPLSGDTGELIRHRGSELGTRLAAAAPAEARNILGELQLSVEVHDDRLVMHANVRALVKMILGTDATWITVEPRDSAHLELVVPVQMKRRGQELRLVFGSPDQRGSAEIDPKLIGLMVRAQRAREKPTESAAEISLAERPHLNRLARLYFLAPDIIASIMDGRQPAEMTPRSLLRVANLPNCWQVQRQLLGFV